MLKFFIALAVLCGVAFSTTGVTPIADKSTVTAGTRVAITATTTLRGYSVVIQAKASNTGKIYVGDSSVTSTKCVAELSAGQSVTIDAVQNAGRVELVKLSNIYIDSSVNAEGVHIGYVAVN